MEILKNLHESKLKQEQVNLGITTCLLAHPVVKLRKSDRGRNSLNVIRRMLRKLDVCGDFLYLQEWLEHEGVVTLKNANFCKNHLLCGVCAIRRAAKSCSAYKAKIRQVIEEFSGLIPIAITLTIANEQDLKVGVLKLETAWKKMLKHARSVKNKSRGYEKCKRIEWNKVKGFVRAMEITNNGKGKGWHPHYHIFVLAENYFDFDSFREDWKGFTAGSWDIWIEEVKADSDNPEDLDGLDKALIHTLKYAVKFADMTPEYRTEIWAKLRSKPFIRPGGILTGVKVELTDDELTGKHLDYYAYWISKWVSRKKVTGYNVLPLEHYCKTTKAQRDADVNWCSAEVRHKEVSDSSSN